MPKISIAIAGRNDNYNDKYFNNLERLKKYFNNVSMALAGIDYEILLLDYNPPKDKPLLSECFSKEEFPKINHVVFSNEDHKRFINCHEKVNAKLYMYNKKNNKIELEYKKIYESGFLSSLAFNLSIKYSSGEYILLGTGDTYYHYSFKDFIKKLQPNILYKSKVYINRKYDDIYDRGKKYDIGKINKIIKKIVGRYEKMANGKEVNISEFILRNSITKSPGEFILMDKYSWREVGAFLPSPCVRLNDNDVQLLFYAMVNGKKIQFVDFESYNLRSINSYAGTALDDMNYIVEYNGMRYDHHQDLIAEYFDKKGRYKRSYTNKVFEQFFKWAYLQKFKKDKKYYIELNYKKRFDEIKKIFNFVDDDFLLWEKYVK